MARESEEKVEIIDFSTQQTSDFLLPQPAVLKSSGWIDLHLEHHRQPEFETPEHQANWHAIAYCPPLPGSANTMGERWLDGKLATEARHEGDIAIIPAGISHRCNWHTRAQFTIVAIEPALLQQVGRDWVNPDRIELIPRYMTEQDSLLQGIVSTLREELETSKIAPHLLIDSLKTTLAVRLLSKYCTIRPKLSSYEGGLAKANLQQIKDYIDVNLDRDLKLIELAQLVRLSPYHFLRLFKQSMGVTPHQYIVARRVEQAKRLLERDQLSIAEVAASVGFCDQSHLARYFKRIVGVTPKQLRRFVRENSRERDPAIPKYDR